MISWVTALLTLAWFGHWEAIGYLLVFELVILTPVQIMINLSKSGKISG